MRFIFNAVSIFNILSKMKFIFETHEKVKLMLTAKRDKIRLN